MCFHRRRSFPLEKSVFGLKFAHPLDFEPLAVRSEALPSFTKAGKHYRCLELMDDVEHLFSSLYDFADMLVIPTASFDRVEDPDLVETLDAVLSMRLIYDEQIPVLLRLSPGMDKEEMDQILAYSRLNGINGLLVPGLDNLKYLARQTEGRIPLIAYAHLDLPEDAVARLQEGAALVESSGKKAYWIREVLEILSKHD